MPTYLPAKRPLAVTLTFWSVILVGLWNVGKLFALSRHTALFLTWQVQPDPRLQAVLAAVWAIVLAVAAWQLRQARPYTHWLIPLLFVVFGLYTAVLRLAFSPSPFHHREGWLILIFFIATAVGAFLGLQQAKQKQYFVERRS